MLYGSIYKTFWKWPDDGDGKHISVCRGLGPGEGEEGGCACKRLHKAALRRLKFPDIDCASVTVIIIM